MTLHQRRILLTTYALTIAANLVGSVTLGIYRPEWDWAYSCRAIVKKQSRGLDMKLITRQSRANDAAKDWAEQYPNDDFVNNYGEKAGDKRKALESLGENPNPDDVDAIIGNDSWTSLLACSECGADDMPVVEIGEEPDDESETAWICKPCLEKAVSLFDGI